MWLILWVWGEPKRCVFVLSASLLSFLIVFAPEVPAEWQPPFVLFGYGALALLLRDFIEENWPKDDLL